MKKNNVALITGITGQDRSNLAEFLLKKGYEVHGIKRRSSSINTDRINHLYQDPRENARKLILNYGDISDSMSIVRIIQKIKPDNFYNLAEQSHVGVSFETPVRFEAFVTRKITRCLSKIYLGLQNKLYLGNLYAKSYLGHAKDYVVMQWLMPRYLY